MSTIYCIKNKSTSACYVGSTHNAPFSRWQAHVSDLNNGKHHSVKFQIAWVGTNLHDWEFVILESGVPDSERHTREQYWFKEIGPELNGTSSISRMIERKRCIKIALEMLGDGKSYREIQKVCGCSLGWLTSLKRKSTHWAQEIG